MSQQTPAAQLQGAPERGEERDYFVDSRPGEMGSDRPLGPAPAPGPGRHTALYFTDDKRRIKFSNLF